MLSIPPTDVLLVNLNLRSTFVRHHPGCGVARTWEPQQTLVLLQCGWLFHQRSLGLVPPAVKSASSNILARAVGKGAPPGLRALAGHRLAHGLLVRDGSLLTCHMEGGRGFQSEIERER